MVLDSNGQDAQFNDLDNLVNIPIQMPDCNGILKERTKNCQRQKGHAKQVMNTQNKRKWKRLHGQENIANGKLGIPSLRE